MSLRKVPMKAGGGVKLKASLELDAGIHGNPESSTTTRHRPTEKLSEDTYQPVYSPRPTKREGKGREGKETNWCTNA